MRKVYSFEEFTEYCRKKICPRTNCCVKRCSVASRQEECFRKYCAVCEKERSAALKIDPKWEKVRKIVLQRDQGKCRLWEILTDQERSYVMTHFAPSLLMLRDIDCAHEQGRNAAPEHKYNPDMIFSLCRYFHTLMDTYKDPVTREPMSALCRQQWWDRIRTGRSVTSPYQWLTDKRTA